MRMRDCLESLSNYKDDYLEYDNSDDDQFRYLRQFLEWNFRGWQCVRVLGKKIKRNREGGEEEVEKEIDLVDESDFVCGGQIGYQKGS